MANGETADVLSTQDGISLVVFDLAGTTIEDRSQVSGAFMRTLEELGIAIDPEALSRIRGTSKREAISALIPAGPGHAERCGAARAKFHEYLFDALRIDPPTFVQGAPALFDNLRSRAIRVALNTGFEREVTEAILSMLACPPTMFDAVVCGDDVRRGRPAPYLIFRAMEATKTASVHTVVNVGDTTNDLFAGFNAGVRWNVGVLSGAHDRDTLANAPHTHIVPSIAELPSHIPGLA